MSTAAEAIDPTSAGLWSHEFLDALSLARHRRVATMLKHDPSLVKKAATNLDRWLKTEHHDDSEVKSLMEWSALLSPSRFDELLSALTDESQNGTRMRQSSPFAGIMAKADYRALRAQMIQEWIGHETRRLA